VRRLRLAGLALAASTLLVATSCGSDAPTTAAGGARLVPASTAVFVSLNTDPDGEQWQAAAALLAKFPGGAGLIESFLADLEGESLDFDADLRPAFGPETDFVALSLSGEAPFVLLTQPPDPAKLKKLVESGDEPGVVTELEDGWWAASSSQATLDSYAAAREGDTLADSGDYTDAVGDLPEDALARVYVNGDAAGEATSTAPGTETLPFDQAAFANCLAGGSADASGSIAFAVRAEDGGIRLNGATSAAVIQGDTQTSELAEFFPGGALAFVSVSGLGEGLRSALGCIADAGPEMAQGLAQLQLGLGVAVEDVTALFDGELGVAVYLSGLQPSVVVATEVDDEQAALDLVNGLVDRLTLFSGGQVTVQDAGDGGKAVTVNGTTVYYGAVDGKLVLTTSALGLAQLGGGSPLAEDADYTAALDAAGMPGDATSIIYVNLHDAVGLAGLAAASSGSAPDVLANVEPLGSLLLWGEEPDGGTVTFEGFLEID
jgi:hypothetical protein